MRPTKLDQEEVLAVLAQNGGHMTTNEIRDILRKAIDPKLHWVTVQTALVRLDKRGKIDSWVMKDRYIWKIKEESGIRI